MGRRVERQQRRVGQAPGSTDDHGINGLQSRKLSYRCHLHRTLLYFGLVYRVCRIKSNRIGHPASTALTVILMQQPRGLQNDALISPIDYIVAAYLRHSLNIQRVTASQTNDSIVALPMTLVEL